MNFQRTVYRLHSSKLTENLKIVFLSDLHSREYGPGNSELLIHIAEEKPDLILCGGDMIVARQNGHFRKAMTFLLELRKTAPVIFANGNHESELRRIPERYKVWSGLLERGGIRTVNNARIPVRVKNQNLLIYGLELPLLKYRKLRVPHMDMGELVNLLGPSPESSGSFSVLLAHNPQFMQLYLRWGADLTLSGHFHGGFMRLWKNKVLISPYGIPFPKYGYGKFEENGHAGIVTSGLGDHTLPFRIHNPEEYVVVDCRSAQ